MSLEQLKKELHNTNKQMAILMKTVAEDNEMVKINEKHSELTLISEEITDKKLSITKFLEFTEKYDIDFANYSITSPTNKEETYSFVRVLDENKYPNDTIVLGDKSYHVVLRSSKIVTEPIVIEGVENLLQTIKVFIAYKEVVKINKKVQPLLDLLTEQDLKQKELYKVLNEFLSDLI